MEQLLSTVTGEVISEVPLVEGGVTLLLTATLAAYVMYATLGDTSRLWEPSHTGDNRSG